MSFQRKEKGAALFVAVLIIIPLTLLAVVVMSTSGLDLKMAGASAGFVQSSHILEGAMEETLDDTNLPGDLASMTSAATMTKNPAMGGIVTFTYRAEITCKRRVDASSTNTIPACRYVDAAVSQGYGKARTSDGSRIGQVGLTVGVEQPVLTSS
ncbi:pilus assembly PilX family protein [Dongshaea marina]|uniref:pilus assembly PilX family protein n=1 Tax=Dongshaea marina TaxID=2047966 RepID=UPI000D3E49A8|nr:hypothetical protein [Dongshaea marina]